MSQFWTAYPIGHGYLSNYAGPNTDTPHFADDVETPFHTPITALLSGTVKQADYAVWSGRPGGGEVFVAPDQGGPEYYLYHLDHLSVSPGQHVAAGQVLGLSGGQNSGGEHPVSAMWSSGPHTHVGYFEKYVATPAGTRPYGPDITSLLQHPQISGNAEIIGSASSSSSPACYGISLPGGNCLGTQSPGPLYQAGFVVVGLLLIFLGLKHFLAPGTRISLSLPGGGQTSDNPPLQEEGQSEEAQRNARPGARYLRQTRGRNVAPPPAEEAK